MDPSCLDLEVELYLQVLRWQGHRHRQSSSVRLFSLPFQCVNFNLHLPGADATCERSGLSGLDKS